MTAVLEAPTRDRDGVEYRPRWEHVAFYVFVWVPLGAVFAGVALAAAGRTLSWLSLGLAAGFYVVTAHGVTVGYHRLFTHSSFKATRPLKIALAIAGSMAIQGGVIRWVADHRKHHQHSDGPMDPHSPWRFGTGPRALAKGLYWAHTGWLFQREQAVKAAYAPGLLADPHPRARHRLVPPLGPPTLLGA